MPRVRLVAGLAAVAGVCLFAVRSPSQTKSATPTPVPAPTPVGGTAHPTAHLPKLVPVAETKLLMEGINKPNFDALAKGLKQKPADAESWGYARGQALLIAETANLLLIRPPKTRQAQEAWVPRCDELRDAGVRLAKAAGEKDYVGARAGLAEVSNACNRCHESFGVQLRLSPLPPE